MQENSIQFTVIRFQDKFAVLNNQIFGEIKWPIKKLPDQIEIGDKINLLATTEEITERNNTLPSHDLKKILEELIEK